MRGIRRLPILVLALAMLSCSLGGTYRLYVRYQPLKEFPTLQEKIGLNLAIVPVKDERPDTLYTGLYVPLTGNYIYYKSEPSPLGKAIEEALPNVLPAYGIKMVTVSDWNGQPDSLDTVQADSVLMIEIKKFWIEGKAGVLGTDITASLSLVMHLGVKKEGKVFTRNIGLERQMKDFRLTPGLAEQTMNRLLTEVLDSYFSNPY
jgi:hypothetical protein